MNKIICLLLCLGISGCVFADDQIIETDDGKEVEVEKVMNPDFATELILKMTYVKRIDEDDMTVARLIELLEGSLGGRVKIELSDGLKSKEIFLKLENVSVLTVLKVMQESLGSLTKMEFKQNKVIIHGPEE